MNNLKQKFTIENALCLYIVLCPILDIVSFLFRKALGTSISPSTFVRPIISISVAIAIFIKCNFKRENDYSRTNLCYIWDNTFMFIPAD